MTDPSGGDRPPISVALTGDAIITRPWSSIDHRAFLSTLEVIRSQDAALTNLEISILDYETYPMVESGGLHLRAPPQMAKELVWAGFTLASFANNHANDWGVEGLRLTCKHARAAGLTLAGVGENIEEARAPQFVSTARGRIALVACASTFTPNARAGDSQGDIPARPGLSPLRFATTNMLTPAGMTALRTVAAELGQALPDSGPFTFLDHSYQLGVQAGKKSDPHPGDLAQLVTAVRSARDLADLVIVSVHAHEEGQDPHTPPAFLITFARAMIDAGADLVFGHGPHILRGIELYRGKPIFYSLGNFVFQNETVDRLPLDDYESIGADPAQGVPGLNIVRYDSDRRGFPAEAKVWESVIAVPRWQAGILRSLELHPVSLGFGRPCIERGTPLVADEDTGRKIIGTLQRLSKPFGTAIDYRAGIGIVALS